MTRFSPSACCYRRGRSSRRWILLKHAPVGTEILAVESMLLLSHHYAHLVFLVTRWKNAWDRITHHTVSGSSQTYLINLALPNYDNARSDNVPLRVHDFPNLLHPLAADGAEQRVNRYQPLATFCTCPAFTYTILLCPHGPRSTPLMVNFLVHVLKFR